MTSDFYLDFFLDKTQILVVGNNFIVIDFSK